VNIVKTIVAIGLLLGFIIVLATCGGAEESSPDGTHDFPAGHPVVDATTVEQVSEGQRLFAEAGCAGCHGPDGLGASAPHIIGHSADIVKLMVRDPVDQMPPFDESQLSEEDLNKIAEYIGSLSGSRADVERTVRRGITHLQLALQAIDIKDEEAALYHLSGGIRYAHDVDRIPELNDALALLESGDWSGAREIIVSGSEMQEAEQRPLDEMYLDLGVLALRAGDTEDATRNLSLYVDLTEDDEAREDIEEALDLIDDGEIEHALAIAEGLLSVLERAEALVSWPA
jgi:mono/diheme cytochrome c family protein